jgi:ribonucleoside-diphosphate reductase alpha chain
MNAVIEDKNWDLLAIKDGRVIKTVKAKELFNQFCQATWECADPGMQFDDTVNKWHTTPSAGRINASNPCSEFMSLDYTACNLASINLMKYLRQDGSFDIEAFKHTITIVLMAQEILVDYSYYPIEKIGNNTKIYRALGLGYANLGAMLMAQGIAYDSEEGRAQAAAMTALMTGQAYGVSAKIAGKVGAFSGFHKDREAMLKVLQQHRQSISGIGADLVDEELLNSATSCWEETLVLAESNGLRNCQATLLAPTGTIGLMMDCDTTGIEPDLGLVKSKKLVGGGTMSIVNQTVPRALRALGYTKSVIDEVVAYIDKEKTIVGAPGLSKEHLAVFACSMGDNSIHYLGHVRMMAAVQPFLSGAISKTVNLPQDTTVEEIAQLHIDAWKMGIKAIAIYRDNCKVSQPVTMGKKEGQDSSETVKTTSLPESFIVKGAVRRVLPRRRNSHTYKFYLADLKGFFTVGEYEDGAPGELFISVAKQGSTLSGLMNSFAISVSHGLQYGVPLKSYVRTLMGTSFAPAGITDDKEIRTATSVIDYIFKRLAMDYLSFDDRLELGLASIDDIPQDQTTLLKDSDTATIEKTNTKDMLQKDSYVPNIAKDPAAPICYNCGNQTQRAGSCYVCSACGSTTGCS